MAGPRGQALHPYVAAIFDETRSTLAIVNIRGHDRFYCNDSFSRTFFTEVRATPHRCPSRMLGPLFLTTRSRIFLFLPCSFVQEEAQQMYNHQVCAGRLSALCCPSIAP